MLIEYHFEILATKIRYKTGYLCIFMLNNLNKEMPPEITIAELTGSHADNCIRNGM